MIVVKALPYVEYGVLSIPNRYNPGSVLRYHAVCTRRINVVFSSRIYEESPASDKAILRK